MSVFDELLEDAQPGYGTQVAVLLNRMQAEFGEAAFTGVEKEDFVAHFAQLLASGAIRPDTAIQSISDLFALSWWCGFEITDAASGAIAALARRTFYRGARAVSLRTRHADLAALRNHIVFVGSIVNPLHSPTRGAFDYARALAQDPDTDLVEVFHAGTMSAELKDYADQRLGEHGRKVRYVSQNGDPNFLLPALHSGPRSYHMWCEAPMAPHISLVALFGPTLMFTCGDAAPIQFADVYWYCHDEAYVADLWRRRGAPETFIANYKALESCAFNRQPPAKPRSRAALGFREDEIVIVTVGNRLTVDMDQPFVDGMGALMVSNPRLRWVIVGPLQDFWVNALETVLGDRFTHVTNDPDLASLLAQTDIFANPFRAGGGNAAVMAIDAGSLVLTRGDIGDVGAFVPASHRAPDAESYFQILRALIADPKLRAARLAAQQALLARRLDQDTFARELKALTKTAFDRFVARLPVSLERIYGQTPPKSAALKLSGRRVRLR